MSAYSGLKTRIDRLANTAKVYESIPYMGFISQNEDAFILDIRMQRKGRHDRSEESRFQSFNGIIESIVDIENKYGTRIIVFYGESDLVN